MIKPKILSIGLILALMLGMIMIVPSSRAEEDQDLSRGHTAISGYSEQRDSNFLFDIRGRYWYHDLHLTLYTFKSNSTYEIMIKGNLHNQGKFTESKEINITLEGYETVNLKVKIDGYQYTFRNKLLTTRDDDSNWGKERKEQGDFMTDQELKFYTARIMVLVMIFSLIGLPIGNHYVDRKLKNEVHEVV